MGHGGRGERAHHGLDGGETIGGEVLHGVAGEFTSAGRGEVGAFKVGEKKLGDCGGGDGEGDIGEALGVGGRGGEMVEFGKRGEGDAGFEGEA